MLRQPLRTVLFAILIGTASFFLVARIIEYKLVVDETERIGEYYRSIGYFSGLTTDIGRNIQNIQSYNERWWRGIDFISDEMKAGAAIIRESDYFAYEIESKRIFGIMDGIKNTDIEGWDYWNSSVNAEYYHINPESDPFNNEAFIYATCTDINPNVFQYTDVSEFNAFLNHEYYLLTFIVDSVRVGYEEHILPGLNINVRVRAEDNAPDLLNQFDIGSQYFMRVSRQGLVLYALTSTSHFTQMTPGGENYLYLNRLSDDFFVIPVQEIEAIDFSAPNLQNISAKMEILDENQRTLHVIAVNDMSAIPITQEVSREWYLSQGRWLSLEDNENQNHVIVLHKDFADMRGLSIGDTIKMTLRDTVDKKGALIGFGEGIPYSLTDWRELPTIENTYEIVGLYSRNRQHMTLSSDTRDAFVPLSTIPLSYTGTPGIFNHYFYSFVLTSTKHQEAFLRAYGDILEELGVKMHFVEHDGERFWEAVNPVIYSLSFNAILFIILYLLVIALLASAYIRQKKREIWIQRVLGVSSKRIMMQILISASLLWTPMVTAGVGMAWASAHAAARGHLADLVATGSRSAVDASLSLLIGICAFTVIFPHVALCFTAMRIVKRPALEILAGKTG